MPFGIPSVPAYLPQWGFATADAVGSTATDPAWSEAHHINDWLNDNGYTDLADGVLLCHPHHLLLHNQQWSIIRTETDYWLRPPVEVNPDQTLIALPSKRANP